MPKFTFRLEAQDGSGHHRTGSIVEATEEDARATLTQQELGKAAYRLDTDEFAALKDDQSPTARVKRALHEQAEPYNLVTLEKAGK